MFGPRQTGKSTLLQSLFSESTTYYYDLLKTEEFTRLSAHPELFREEILSRNPQITHVFVDEVQRVPELLNEIQFLIESKNAPYFLLSGSSARKLKRVKANLLAGRAFEHFIILEIMRLADYNKLDFNFSYYRTEGGAEVDLIIESPRGQIFAIEIKANDRVDSSSLRGLKSFAGSCPEAKLCCVCLASHQRKMCNIVILPWQELYGWLTDPTT